MLYADLVLVNGNVITMNSKQPKARAAAIKDGRFVAVGINRQILRYVGRGTRKINLKGKTVIPGFIDSHVHGASFGQSLSRINLREVKSIKEMRQKVKQWAKRMPWGNWIIGRGWDQDKLAEHRYPTCFDLDQAASDHPVLLFRVCGHMGIVNSKAMRLAGITKKSESPKGGCIDIDPDTGQPNGILRENALDLVSCILPKPSEETLMDACLLACKRMVEDGITTAHWIIGSASEIDVFQRLNESNMLPLRIYALIPVEYLDHLTELSLLTGFGNEWVRIGGVKILADGSLGARTAALKQPYSDAPNAVGMLLYSQRRLERLVEKAHEAGLQLAIHAIGDRTIELVLKTLKKVLQKVPRKNHRHRLEHASVLNPRLIRKMKETGVIASVQPHFIVSDFWIADRLGKARARWAYPLKSLLEVGVMTMAGSDAPIEPVSPILGIHAAATRETFPEERLTFDEALRLYTVNAAYGSFEEELKGSIEKGKLADLVVLSQDPHMTEPQKIKEIRVEMTIVGGNIAYARKP